MSSMEGEDGSLTTGSCLYFSQKNAEYYPFSHFVFDIILLVFLFLSYASWWRNESTNQEVKWGKFCSGK